MHYFNIWFYLKFKVKLVINSDFTINSNNFDPNVTIELFLFNNINL